MLKLKYKEAAYVLNYKKSHRLQKWLCDWTIEEKGDGYYIKCQVKLPIFIIVYLPVAIVEFALYAWDEGIKYYHLPTRLVFSCHSSSQDYVTKRVKEVLAARKITNS